MPINSSQRLPLLSAMALSTLAALAGCQLLGPYQAPLTPTPREWKGSYGAPDAGIPAIPPTWKDEVEHQTALHPAEHSLLHPTDEAKSLNEGSAGNTDLSIPSHLDESQSHEGEQAQKEPEENKEPSFEEVCQELDNWWEIFQDPLLNDLEEQAIASSYTLWAALERVIEARATARINFAPLMPQINFAPSFSRTGALYQNPLPSTGSSSTTGPLSSFLSSISSAPPAAAASAVPTIPADFRFVQSQYLVPLNFQYEIDLWSQLDNAYYASVFKAQAVSQAYLSVLLSLTADVAAAYFQLRGLDAQQEVLRRNIHIRQHAVDINRSRYNAGLIVYVDVSRAEVELWKAHSDNDEVHRLRGLQENILATLVGVPASVFSIEYNPVFVPPPVIPTGLPSELLCRRPDVAEAERNLAAAYREIGVAYANFFPSLTLNAALGVSSPFPHQLFSWKSRFWEVGVNILQTVFDGGRIQANLDYYRAGWREAMANYQEQVLQSFKDVEDSLVSLRWYAKQAQDLAKAVSAARTTLELSQMRYNRGLVNYLDVVDAERDLLQTEQNSVIVLGNRYVSTVMLIRALGGGWGPCDTCDEE